MFSGTTKYLMDANAIRNLDIATVKAKLGNDRIIATIPEVKHEVSGLSEELALIHLENLGDGAYIRMKEIMERKSVRGIINYYSNKGAADVALLAHALTATGIGVFEDRVVIVTEDVGLRTACDDLGVLWESVENFKLI
jgi:hypothetical protein